MASGVLFSQPPPPPLRRLDASEKIFGLMYGKNREIE